ncbi:hypothetical protein V5N11_026670 [Cardamine amara subsp. amara]|uniref:SWIM-type domain-containing protein n=1 Tax=Cardamine amara subsp. amara TaxID=228776 RepID=A0ABD1ACF6_CARAN
MLVVEMLEIIRRRTMTRIDLRKAKAINYQGIFILRAVDFLEKEAKKIKLCRFVPVREGRFDVLEAGVGYSVNIRMRTCTCRRWDMSGIPCHHALRVITEKKLNREDYISNWNLNSRQQIIYSDSILPVNGMLFWNITDYVVVPPPSLVEHIENMKGSKPKPKRKKARHESPTKKKKVSRKKRVMHYRICDNARHNKTKCPNFGVERYKPPRKKRP